MCSETFIENCVWVYIEMAPGGVGRAWGGRGWGGGCLRAY